MDTRTKLPGNPNISGNEVEVTAVNGHVCFLPTEFSCLLVATQNTEFIVVNHGMSVEKGGWAAEVCRKITSQSLGNKEAGRITQRNTELLRIMAEIISK